MDAGQLCPVGAAVLGERAESEEGDSKDDSRWMDIYLIVLEEGIPYREPAGKEAGRGMYLKSDDKNAHSTFVSQDNCPNPPRAIVRFPVELAMVVVQVGCRLSDLEQRSFDRTETADIELGTGKRRRSVRSGKSHRDG